MPITATAIKGTINVVMEATAGEQLLLATTAVAATVTGFTAPSGSTGMRLHIKIVGWTASGTLTINGTGTPGNSETVNIPAPTTQQTQSPQLASWEYVSTNAYSALTNVTTTGSPGGTITAWGIQAGKYQLPAVMKSKRVPKTYSPNEHNALIERDKKILQLVNNTTIDEIKQDAYGDLSLWWPYMAMGAPTTTASIPATPTSLKASAAVSGSPFSLTTQPTAPGMILIFTVTGSSAVGTIGISGTDRYTGASTSETITAAAGGSNGNGTYYSSHTYSAVAANGVTFTGLTSGSCAITGVYGWQYTFLSGQALYSAAIEWYDGTGSWTHPFSFATDASFDAKVNTEISLTLKGKAQDKLPIGDRSTSPMAGTNRITSIGTSLADIPMVGWQTALYLDPITGTPQTTLYTNIEELKLDLKIPQEDHFTFTNSQNFNRAYPQKRECMVDAKIDFTDLSQWEQFRQSLKQYLVFQFIGQYLGTNAGTLYSKSWTWTIPFKSDGDFDVTSDPSKGNVYAQAKWRAEYDSGIGGAYQLVVISTVPPTYTA